MVREGNLKILQIFFKVYLQPCGVLRVNFCIFQLGNSFWRFEIYVQMESSKVEVRRGMVGVGEERFIVWNNLKFSCEGHFFRSSHRRSSHLSQLYEKKESLLQVFSCEFCKISKYIFFTEHPRTTASDFYVKVFSKHWFNKIHESFKQPFYVTNIGKFVVASVIKPSCRYLERMGNETSSGKLVGAFSWLFYAREQG